jgi:hypothetical protein
MSESIQCQATTQAGTQCKRNAQEGSAYCYTHRNYAAGAETPPAAEPKPKASKAELNEISSELKDLTDKLNEMASKLENRTNYTPPPYSPQALLGLFRENVHRFSPDIQPEVLETLKEGVKDTSPKEWLDPETWKGMWYLLNYSLAAEEDETLMGTFWRKLTSLPGGSLLAELRMAFEGTTKEDLMDLDTWKGAWMVLSYSMQERAEGLRSKFNGEEEEDSAA